MFDSSQNEDWQNLCKKVGQKKKWSKSAPQGETSKNKQVMNHQWVNPENKVITDSNQVVFPEIKSDLRELMVIENKQVKELENEGQPDITVKNLEIVVAGPNQIEDLQELLVVAVYSKDTEKEKFRHLHRRVWR